MNLVGKVNRVSFEHWWKWVETLPISCSPDHSHVLCNLVGKVSCISFEHWWMCARILPIFWSPDHSHVYYNLVGKVNCISFAYYLCTQKFGRDLGPLMTRTCTHYTLARERKWCQFCALVNVRKNLAEILAPWWFARVLQLGKVNCVSFEHWLMHKRFCQDLGPLMTRTCTTTGRIVSNSNIGECVWGPCQFFAPKVTSTGTVNLQEGDQGSSSFLYASH
jgi:hypothetical protein